MPKSKGNQASGSEAGEGKADLGDLSKTHGIASVGEGGREAKDDYFKMYI